MSPRARLLPLAAVAIALLSVPAAAPAWTPVPQRALDVTSGAIETLPSGQLLTRGGEMRAVQRDHGRHARSARLRFRYRGPSDETIPLGSGQVRRQVGIKLRADDPCNLLYVMWREFPEHAIVVSVKRNPGQSTSAQCGNRGYTDVARVALGTSPSVADHATHLLVARTRPHPDGTMGLVVVADGRTVVQRRIAAALAGTLRGPIGVRSDNGVYRFSLSR